MTGVQTCALPIYVLTENSGSNNKVYSVISALIILVVFGILIGCYLNEVNLFDGPAADDYLYHANEKITVIALTAIFIIMLAVIKKENSCISLSISSITTMCFLS